MNEEVSEETNVETPQQTEVPKNGKVYEGTINSKWGKIVVAMENHQGHLELIDEGPEEKGFKSQGQALDAIKKSVNLGLEGGSLEMENIPTFHILRMVKTVAPRPVQTTVLDFGEE